MVYVHIAAVCMNRTPEEFTRILEVLSDDDVRGFRRELLRTAQHLRSCVSVLRAAHRRSGLCRPLRDGNKTTLAGIVVGT